MLFYKSLIVCLSGLAGVMGDFNKNTKTDGSVSLCADRTDGLYPLGGGKFDRQDCIRYISCENGVATQLNCGVVEPFIGMWSTTNNMCVGTAFPNCKTMRKLCPTLPSYYFMSTLQRADVNDAKLDNEELLQVFGPIQTRPMDKATLEGFKPDPEFDCPQSTGYFAANDHSENPTAYRICLNGLAYIGQCESDEVFDPVNGNCVQTFVKDNDFGPVGEYNCSRNFDGLYGTSEDCRYFQVCCGNAETMRRCPLGTRFDVTTRTCTLKHRATCEQP